MESIGVSPSGCGLAYVPEGLVQQHIDRGRLKRLLADLCRPYSAYHFIPAGDSERLRFH
jgi:hypothetical protein